MRKWRAPSASSRATYSAPGLRPRVEHGVAAAGVGLERMLQAHAVADLHLMFVARAPAIGVIRPLAQKRAEDAMLHVKHRHVLVNGDLEPLPAGPIAATPPVALMFKS